MGTVKEFKGLGIEFVVGENLGSGPILNQSIIADMNNGYYRANTVKAFAPRENKGEQPVGDNVMVDVTFRNGHKSTRLAGSYYWRLNCLIEIVTWKPSLNQPLLSKVKTETVKEFRDLGVEFVDGDTLNTGNMVGSWTDADTRFFEKSPSEYLGYTVESFAPRKNIKRVQPVGDDVTVDVVLRCKRKITKKAKEIEWGIDGCQGDVITWTPSLNRPSLQTETPEDKGSFQAFTVNCPCVTVPLKPIYTQAMCDAGDLPIIGSEYLDEDGQRCQCLGYSSERGFVIGQHLEHPSSNGYPPLSTCEKSLAKPIPTEPLEVIKTEQEEVMDRALTVTGFGKGGTMEDNLNKLYQAGLLNCKK
jgi:hypothetical protein